MALLTVKPNKLDIAIAKVVARKTTPFPEEIAKGLTWGADENLLLPLAAAAWLATRGASKSLRRAGNHALLVTVAASLLPHLLKSVFDQRRPDRETVLGHLRGVPFSGNAEDAFPSGHAVHMGALASAASALPPRLRITAQVAAVVLSLTRIVTLAHWASDVVSGLVMGIVLERLLRLCTGYSTAAAACSARKAAAK